MARAVFAFVLAFGSLLAQDYRARLQGVVSDSSTAAVPGATVVLTNTKTGVAVTRTTDQNGKYFFDYVEPGEYSLSVEASGFSKFIQQNVTVQVRGDVTIDATLQVGGVAESVTITAAPVAVQFNTTSRELTIGGKLIDALMQQEKKGVGGFGGPDATMLEGKGADGIAAECWDFGSNQPCNL